MKQLILSTMMLMAAAAFADRVELKSGSVLTGQAGLIQDGKLQFVSDDVGAVAIAVDKIAKLDTANVKHVFQYNDDSRETLEVLIADGRLVSNGKPVDMSLVKKTDPAIEAWHGSVNGAFLAARGNTYENSWSLFGDVSRRWENDGFAANGGYYYSETGTQNGDDKKKTTDRWIADAQHDHYWMPKLFGFEHLGYERDMIKGLRARYKLGIGPGYQWLDNDMFETTGKWSFRQQVEVQWQREEHEQGDDSSGGFAAFEYKHRLGWIPKWSDALELYHNFRYNPEVDDFEIYKVFADVGFAAKVIGDFSLVGKIEWDYENKPASDRKKSDVRYIAGIGYKW